MRNCWKTILIILTIGVCASTLCACIPPFIDGAVEAEDYFNDSVGYSLYQIEPGEEGGFLTIDGANLALNDLTDSNETNISMQYYLSFQFTAKDDVNLQTIAFVVEVEEPAELQFRLEYDTSIFNQSIDLNTKKKNILQFSELGIDVASSEELLITLANPVIANTRYRIDTVIFVVGE